MVILELLDCNIVFSSLSSVGNLDVSELRIGCNLGRLADNDLFLCASLVEGRRSPSIVESECSCSGTILPVILFFNRGFIVVCESTERKKEKKE